MRLFLPTLFGGLLLLCGCGFSLFEPAEISLPEIEILSISQDNDTTLVAVDVKAGSTPLEFVGLSYSEEEVFSIVDQQDLYGVTKAGVYDLGLVGLTPERTYYFRAFVGEEIAFAESQTVSFFVPRPGPPVIPCTLVRQQIRDRGATFNGPLVRAVDGVGASSQYGLRIECGTGGPVISVGFFQLPTSGVYQTTNFTGLATGEAKVYVDYRSGFLDGVVQTGQEVYVEKLGERHFIVSFCDIGYTVSGSSTIFRFSGEVEVRG